MTQTQFHCPNCTRWEAEEITREVAHHERRAFRCRFCGHCFTENQSVDEFNASVAEEEAMLSPWNEVACPVDDPSCTSGDDQCHDACEPPDTFGSLASGNIFSFADSLHGRAIYRKISSTHAVKYFPTDPTLYFVPPERAVIREDQRCDLCGDPIRYSAIFDPREMHGYGECVEMPDNFMSPYFDELRHRGVAIAATIDRYRQ